VLFPQLGASYYDEKDKGIIDRMTAFYSESITINQSFWGEADTDTRFYNGATERMEYGMIYIQMALPIDADNFPLIAFVVLLI
jgi:hypothetical protein